MIALSNWGGGIQWWNQDLKAIYFYVVLLHCISEMIRNDTVAQLLHHLIQTEISHVFVKQYNCDPQKMNLNNFCDPVTFSVPTSVSVVFT